MLFIFLKFGDFSEIFFLSFVVVYLLNFNKVPDGRVLVIAGAVLGWSFSDTLIND